MSMNDAWADDTTSAQTLRAGSTWDSTLVNSTDWAWPAPVSVTYTGTVWNLTRVTYSNDEKGVELLVNDLKSRDIDQASVEELILLGVIGTLMRQGYHEAGYAEPDYLDERLEDIREEVGHRHAQEKRAEIKRLKAERKDLVGKKKRVAEIDERLFALEAE